MEGMLQVPCWRLSNRLSNRAICDKIDYFESGSSAGSIPMKNIDHFILIFCILLTACANVSPSPIATVTASSLPSATPGPTATPTPEATATQEAPKIAPYEQLLQLNYSKDYLDKFTNIHASTTFLYGNTFDSITGTDAKGKEVVLAVKWGIPELKKEGVWLQHYKMGRLEILMSPQINGYIDTSKVTEAQANAFVADYLARSKALTGDTRYDNVIKNNGDVIVVVASMDDNPFPGAGTGSVYLDGGNTKLYRTTGRGSSLISAWFPKDKASMVAMSF